MSLKNKFLAAGRHGAIGAALAVAGALACLNLPIDGFLARLSFDLCTLLKPQVVPDEARLIYIDDKSANLLGQQINDWDRGLHTALLERLRRDQAALVIFDIWFDLRGGDRTNALLATAMADSGKVVLGSGLSHDERPGIATAGTIAPAEIFRSAAAGWGISAVSEDMDSIVRRYHPGTKDLASLPWTAARLAGAASATNGAADPELGWLNFYGPKNTLPHLSYCEAQEQPSNHFKGKFVFVGSRPDTPYPRLPVDEFRTPYSRWGDGYSPGVDFAATAFLNLWRNEWLTLMPRELEMAVVIACGVVLGFGLGIVRPLPATVLAILSVLGVALAAVWLMYREHVWFSWLLVAGVETPFAWAWSVFGRRMRFLRASDPAGTDAVRGRVMAEESPTAPDTSRLPAPADAQPALAGAGGTRKIAVVSDHTLLRCVGRGAYGEVWLARDIIGSFHAVKIVYRNSFDSGEPYEREFHGLQKYTPISRTHPGWVHMLHIGRNDPEGYFFCIMEAGDDEVSGQQIDPNSYQPRNLARELRKHGRLPIDECVRLGVALAEALEHLHRHRLIHRDIKPSNVIFVKGAPKFADIGLVTELKGADGAVSYLGTEGYIAPEGPGTASADVYSLGKLLYEISMGRDRREFPELPTVVLGRPETSHLRRLQKIVMRACADEPLRRYQSAEALSSDLRELQRSLEAAGP